MKKLFRNLLDAMGDCVMIACGLLLLLIGVILQAQYPVGFAGREPNMVILYAEVAMSIGIVWLGIQRAIADRGCCVREAFGDLVIIASGVVLVGLFVTILLKEEYVMYQTELAVLIFRSIAAAAVVVLGIERFIDDLK